MESFSRFMREDHRACDDLFVAAENAADRGDWSECRQAWTRFSAAILRHFALEETVLFPAFEQATGMTGGPTEVMRREHAQMRELLAPVEDALAGADPEAFLGHTETLLVLMQQHNLKEENVLYPMADRVLAGQREALLDILRESSPV